MSVINNLDTLYECREKLGDLIAKMHEAVEKLLPPEIAEAQDKVRAEYVPQCKYLEQQIAKLEAEIKESTLLLGQSIRGKNLMAVYQRGRISWETSKLEGFAEAFPEIKQFRKVGEPTVIIRAVKEVTKDE